MTRHGIKCVILYFYIHLLSSNLEMKSPSIFKRKGYNIPYNIVHVQKKKSSLSVLHLYYDTYICTRFIPLSLSSTWSRDLQWCNATCIFWWSDKRTKMFMMAVVVHKVYSYKGHATTGAHLFAPLDFCTACARLLFLYISHPERAFAFSLFFYCFTFAARQKSSRNCSLTLFPPNQSIYMLSE